ncbi:cardiolipin synthase [Paenibacillus sp. J31TS4]|uniref:cardiolipin synthase n=1 Tax=Paenibacillus sp. J31TS4 TaxID=2807195 RepID=UPI001B11DA48|nr:cardiolipin synthase [Paenibacillus sp. J31TS4]GIP39994.1 cardiolipin synthase [Paenibacillus sp. J31TS4]
MNGCLLLLVLVVLQGLTVILLEFRYPSKTVAWLLVLFIFPILGFIMYVLLGRRFAHGLQRRRRQKAEKAYEESGGTGESVDAAGSGRPEGDPRLLRLLARLPGSRAVPGNDVRILTNAEETYGAILEAMEQARDHIHLEYYTVRDDGIGRVFLSLLERKAREGVRVRLLYDGIGSHTLSRSSLAKLSEAGAEIGCFLPPLLAFVDSRINYRNHRKLVVVDGRIGFLGGINIGDEYLGKDPKLGFWRDTHMQLRGHAVRELQRTFLIDWAFVRREPLTGGGFFPEPDRAGSQWVQMITSGPDGRWDPILEAVVAAIHTARRRVLIATPYFSADNGLLMALKLAALSGVEVTVLLPGRPDSRIVYCATLSYLKELLQAGVRFYRYQKGFLHAKVMVVDDSFASVGTANMDMRSFYTNFEMNAVIFDRGTVDRLMKDFEDDLENSEEIEREVFLARPRWQRGKELLCRLISPLL